MRRDPAETWTEQCGRQQSWGDGTCPLAARLGGPFERSGAYLQHGATTEKASEEDRARELRFPVGHRIFQGANLPLAGYDVPKPRARHAGDAGGGWGGVSGCRGTCPQQGGGRRQGRVGPIMAASAQPDASVPKTVYLVRHAQSEQNVASQIFFESGDAKALGTMLRLGYDAPLSEAGRVQLDDASRKLASGGDANFAKQRGIQLVATSPYVRAIDTAKALFPNFAASSTGLVVVPAMHERTLSEYFFPRLLAARVDEVRRWLDSRPERVLALVGHGQFFRMCLGTSHVQHNASIVECSYSSTDGFRDGKLAFEGFPDPAPSWRDAEGAT
jgi:phosphohistidine phosphatase SixA